MARKLYCGQDAEFQRMADEFIEKLHQGKAEYMDASTLADIADYFAFNGMGFQMKETVDFGLSIHPNHSDLLLQKAFLYIDRGEYDKAEAIYQQIENKESKEVRQLEALLAYRQDDVAKADDILDSLKDDFEPEDTFSLVCLMLDLDRPDEALQLLEASDADPEGDAYLDNKAACYRALGEYDEAIETLNQLIDKQPFQPRVWNELAECYLDIHQYDKAIEACDFALATDEDYIPSLLLKGSAYSLLNNCKEYYNCYSQAYELGGTSVVAFTYAKVLYLTSIDEWDKALVAIEEMEKELTAGNVEETEPLRRSEMYALTLNLGTFCFIQKGLINEAKEIAMKTIRTYGEYAETRRMMALIAANQGQMDEARANWRKCYQNENATVDTLYALVADCVEYDEQEMGFEAMKWGYDCYPNDPGVLLMYLNTCLLCAHYDLFEALCAKHHLPLPDHLNEKFQATKQANEQMNGKLIIEINAELAKIVMKRYNFNLPDEQLFQKK